MSSMVTIPVSDSEWVSTLRRNGMLVFYPPYVAVNQHARSLDRSRGIDAWKGKGSMFTRDNGGVVLMDTCVKGTEHLNSSTRITLTVLASTSSSSSPRGPFSRGETYKAFWQRRRGRRNISPRRRCWRAPHW